MKKIFFTALLLAGFAPAMLAVTTHDKTITAIFGSGNTNDGWESNVANNIELALRGKNVNNNATTNNGFGTYFFAAGNHQWNFEFSINSNLDSSSGPNLAGYSFVLSVDHDPSAGINFLTFNPMAPNPVGFDDNFYGTNSTPHNGGTKGTLATSPALQLINNIAQNSENIVFSQFGLDPTIDGIYTFQLAAYSLGDIAHMNPLALTSIRVIVGSPIGVPDTGTTVAMLGLALIGMAGFGLRKRPAKV